VCLSEPYVYGLAFLGAATEQDDQHITVLAEVNAVARPEVDFILGNTFADSFDVRGVALAQPVERCRDLGGSNRIQTVEPFAERRCTVGIKKRYKLYLNHL